MTFLEVTQLVTAFATAFAAIAAAVISWRNGTRIHEVHLSLNSRLDTLLSVTREAGVASGREIQKKETSDAQRR